MDEKEESICEEIEKKGIRLTPQRKDIIRILINDENKHLSASDIYDLLQDKNNTMGLATVYRTLDLLTKMGIVVKRDFDGETSRYELVINKVNHHHLICKKCGKVIEIPDFLPEDIKNKLLQKKGFKPVDYSIKFYGYCQECRKKLNN